MYPPRSNKGKATRRVKKRRLSKSWVLLNLFLVAMIMMLLSYYWITEDDKLAQPVNSSINTPLEPLPKTDNLNHDIDISPTKDKPIVKDTTKESESVKPEASKESAIINKPKESEPAEEEPKIAEKLDDSNDPSKIVANADTILNFHFAGDMIFSGKVEGKLKQEGYDYPFKHLGDLFQKDDLTIANLETPVTNAGIGATNKQYVFKSSPKALDALKKAGMDAVGLANNHILDQGVSGLMDTLKHLEESDLQYAGAGKNAGEAYAPAYFTRQGVKIALVAVSRVVPDTDWFAAKGRPGVASAYDPTAALQSIAKARKNADIVIVMAHWGEERALNPNANQTQLAHQFVDAGADLVIGSHPHVLQGLEQYKGKWIAYSTGNFIFTKSATPSTWKTAVFATTCTPKGECKMKLIPYHAEIGQPVPMSDKEGQQLFKEIQDLSIGGVTISKDGTVVQPKS